MSNLNGHCPENEGMLERDRDDCLLATGHCSTIPKDELKLIQYFLKIQMIRTRFHSMRHPEIQ